MCTVTFTPKPNNDFILTSNRDEAPGRETLFPKIYNEEGVQLLYPKDEVAGGTWIGASEMKRVVTLMNGGFVNHERKPFYKKSRGLVVKDLLKCDILKSEIENFDFLEIEPFTAIIVEWKKELQVFQLVWDGIHRHFNRKPLAPRIWSSSPLYPENLRKRREKWFSDFLFKNVSPTADEILHFHRTAGEGDVNDNLIIDRGFVKTKSITQIVKSDKTIKMYYEDLQADRAQTSALGTL